MNAITSPLGVCVLPEFGPNAARTVTYPHYIHEILHHAGVCYSEIEAEGLTEALPGIRILVTVGQAILSDAVCKQLAKWVTDGGAWISIAGVCGMEDLFGVEVLKPAFSVWAGAAFCSLGEGYVRPTQTAISSLAHLRIPLHHFGGIAVKATTGKALAKSLDAHQRETDRVAIVENEMGKGFCVLIAIDLTGTVVRIQQGIAITRDGVPAPDGTGPINDGILKSDDGAVLDWTFDREPVPGVPGFKAFLQPVADQWREVLLRTIFALAERQNVALPLLWLYPRNLPALGHLSHDTDGNVVSDGKLLLDALDRADARGTWLVIAPGYPREFAATIRDAGHELGFHYDAMSEGTVWGEADFKSQLATVSESFEGTPPVSNKNHYLRWEGDTEFYAWCERHGIEFDESKGASKTGEAGYFHGTCHVYFPVDSKGRILNVLELCTPTQDLIVFAPTAIADPILDAAVRHHGIVHFLFHPAHLPKEGIAEALIEVVTKGRALGIEWWTAREINAWERTRRTVYWYDYRQDAHSASVSIKAENDLVDATLMWFSPKTKRIKFDGNHQDPRLVERWGFQFNAITVQLDANKRHSFGVAT